MASRRTFTASRWWHRSRAGSSKRAILSERVTARRERLLMGDMAVLERRCRRHCLTTLRGESRLGA